MFSRAATLWLMIAASVAAAQEPNTPIPPKAMDAIQAGKWDEALKLLEPAIKSGNPDAHYCAGLTKAGLGKLNEAGPYFAAALQARPHDDAAAEMLATCVADSGGNYKSRLPSWAYTLEKLRPYDADAMHAVGRAWMNKYLWKVKSGGIIYGKKPEVQLNRAIEYLVRADALGTSRRDNDRWLAFLRYRNGLYEDGLAHAERYVATGPAGYDIYVIMGSCLTNLGRHEEAELAYSTARSLAPGKVGVIDYNRAKALYRAGRYNEAVEAFRLVLGKSWAQANVRHWIGLAAFRGEDFRLALWGFIESRNVDDRTDSIYFIGRCAYAMGKYALAEKHIQAAIDKLLSKYGSMGSKRREPAEWTHYLGRAQWGQGKRKQALKTLEDAFARDKRPRHARWLFQAWIAEDNLHKAIDVCERFGKAGYRNDAIQALEAMLAKWPKPRMQDLFAKRGKPHIYVIYDALADLYRANSRFRTAAHYYQLGRRTAGPMVRVKACWALLQAGRLEEAAKGFAEYVRRRKSKDYGRFGLACTQMAQKKWAAAAKTFSAIRKESMVPSCESGMVLC
ncbi:MAG: tetratricopeptide repeat protein, partial [Phycisphaerae bacterium]|nr:tetratricopeptide repeat protein [Phycisphaerae bacterium]